MQTLPGVAATDDFRAEFSVRGSPYRHLGVIIDGVATPWLRHTAPGRGDMGSLAMFSGDLLESATLYVGAQPQRHGNILGAQLGLTLREGSREAIRVRGALGGLNAAITAEGPVGDIGSRRVACLGPAELSRLADQSGVASRTHRCSGLRTVSRSSSTT